MSKPLSPIHRPLEDADPAPAPPVSRISRLASLDRRVLSGHQHSLGPGGASALFARAVDRAMVEEMADQLRGELGSRESEIGCWAAEIIAAFQE